MSNKENATAAAAKEETVPPHDGGVSSPVGRITPEKEVMLSALDAIVGFENRATTNKEAVIAFKVLRIEPRQCRHADKEPETIRLRPYYLKASKILLRNAMFQAFYDKGVFLSIPWYTPFPALFVGSKVGNMKDFGDPALKVSEYDITIDDTPGKEALTLSSSAREGAAVVATSTVLNWPNVTPEEGKAPDEFLSWLPQEGGMKSGYFLDVGGHVDGQLSASCMVTILGNKEGRKLWDSCISCAYHLMTQNVK